MAQEIYHISNWGNPTQTWGNSYLNADLTNELYKRASEYENSWVTDQLLNGVGTKPSIILTPTAYEDGLLNSVKPNKTFGSELVTNGSFDTDTNWTKQTGWTISGGVANYDFTSDAKYIRQTLLNGGFVSGKTYRINFEITSGTAYLYINSNGGSLISLNTYSVGSYSLYTTATANGSDLLIYGRNTSGTAFSIDNVSIKEIIDADFDFTRGSSATRVNEQGLVEDVQILSGNLAQNGDFEQIGSELVTNGGFDTDSDWIKGTGWSISGGKAVSDGSQTGNSSLQQSGVAVSGKIYKIQFDLTVDAGFINYVNLGGWIDTTNLTTSGTYTYYTSTTTATDNLGIAANVDFIGSVDNVSVKEVGQNWSFNTGWSMGDGKAIAENVPNLQRLQSTGGTASVIGNKYKYSLNITNVSGAYTLYIYGVNVLNSVSTEGVIEGEVIATSTNGVVFIAGATVGGLISANVDNISVVEVTDDTDLPRINYTNFDYEDVLGDELVTNGTFDSDSNWSKGTGWSIEDGRASYDASGTSALTSASTSIVSNKIYRLKFKITTSGFARLNFTTDGSQSLFQPNGNSLNNFADGEHTFYLTAQNNSTALKIFAYNVSGGTSFSIDNVSVKEFTEDVVVPYSGEGSLLLEPQSTNLITKSVNWDNWTEVRTTLSFEQETSPSGNQDASLLVDSTDNNTHISQAIYGASSGTSYVTWSLFAKKQNNRYISLRLQDDAANASGNSNNIVANYDLESGVVTDTLEVGTPTNAYADIQQYGNGWYRLIISMQKKSGITRTDLQIRLCKDGVAKSSEPFTGTGNDGNYFYGLQLEELSYATSYIPTEGSIKTRLQDVCNNSGNSDLINSTDGVLYAEISALADDQTFRLLSLSDGTSNNRVYIGLGNVSNQIIASITSGGTLQALMYNTVTDTTAYNKIALKYKLNDVSLYVNGTEVATDTSATMPTLSSLQFTSGVSSSKYYGNVKCVAVFKEALSDTELEKLTTI